jgi:hypothetical protein
MKRIVMALLGLLSIALVLAACAPGEEELPTELTPVPFEAPRVDPTPEVEGVRATPEAVMEPAVEHELVERMLQQREGMDEAAARVPERQELLEATEEMVDLMRDLDETYPGMSVEEQEATLGGMVDVMTGLVDMVTSEATDGQQIGLVDPIAGIVGGRGPETVDPATEPQVVQTPSPRVPLPDHSLMMAEIEDIRGEIRERATDSPDVEDTLHALVRIREMLLTVQVLVDTMVDTDAAEVVHELAGATEDFQELMRMYVQEGDRAAPGQEGTPTRLP